MKYKLFTYPVSVLKVPEEPEGPEGNVWVREHGVGEKFSFCSQDGCAEQVSCAGEKRIFAGKTAIEKWHRHRGDGPGSPACKKAIRTLFIKCPSH